MMKWRLIIFVLSFLFSLNLGAQRRHIVQRGETFATVAKKYNLTESELAAANPTKKVCYAGLNLVIPEKKVETRQPVTQGTNSAVNNQSAQSVQEIKKELAIAEADYDACLQMGDASPKAHQKVVRLRQKLKEAESRAAVSGTGTASGGSGAKATGQVKGNSSDGHEYVDLGLPSGTLWATCNVGASRPEDYGDYFAWGETATKITYRWSTYKYCTGFEKTLTKYCTDSEFGTVDNKTELELSDDAAYVNWGFNWRMPNYDQFEELINSSYTTTTWTTVNGVKGRKITSKSNGNSIFLPAAGFRRNGLLNQAGSYGNYWSRTLDASYSDFARGLDFDLSRFFELNYGRNTGRSVRPVRASQ